MFKCLNNYLKLFLAMPFMMVILFCGCQEEAYKWEGNTLIISGDMIVSDGDTLELQPGDVVIFKHNGWFIFPGDSQGSLVIEDGGELIAVGTSTNPIVFKEECETVNMFFKYDCGDGCKMEYCDFTQGESSPQFRIKVENSIIIKHCKFNCYWIDIWFLKESESIVEYNYFNDSGPLVGIGGMLMFYQVCKPTFKYNDISGLSIVLCEGSSTVFEYNNLVGNSINVGQGTPSFVNNYVENTSFPGGVINQSPQSTAIAEAGCGW